MSSISVVVNKGQCLGNSSLQTMSSVDGVSSVVALAAPGKSILANFRKSYDVYQPNYNRNIYKSATLEQDCRVVGEKLPIDDWLPIPENLGVPKVGGVK